MIVVLATVAMALPFAGYVVVNLAAGPDPVAVAAAPPGIHIEQKADGNGSNVFNLNHGKSWPGDTPPKANPRELSPAVPQPAGDARTPPPDQKKYPEEGRGPAARDGKERKNDSINKVQFEQKGDEFLQLAESEQGGAFNYLEIGPNGARSMQSAGHVGLVGRQVNIRRDGRWHPGEVLQERDFKFLVRYRDGAGGDEWVPLSRLFFDRPADTAKGPAVAPQP